MADFSNSNVDRGGDDFSDENSFLEFVVVGNKCKNDSKLKKALKTFRVPIQFSDTGFELMNNADFDTVFVVDKFEGDIFQRLHKSGCRIVGPPVIYKYSQAEETLPISKRPMYCPVMRSLVLCFAGFKVKEELSRLADLVHHMGGSVRKDLNASVTHLIANCTSGEKYRTAVALDTPIMGSDWVYYSWEQKDASDFSAGDTQITTKFKLSPFSFTIISFLGFSKEESRHMEEITVENGGLCAEPGAPNCTHLVVNEHSTKQIPFSTLSKLHIVKSEWFWASIQVEARTDENLYKFEEITDTPENGLHSKKTTPGSKSRKRKRDLKERMAILASEGEVDTPMYKRRSSEMAHLSFSGSFLDATVDTSSGTPLSDAGQKDNQGPLSPTPTPTCRPKEPVAKLSARHELAMELFHTEKNYLGILHTILKVFKEGIERPDQAGGPILGVQEVKAIFGGIPPIYDVHLRIRDMLCEMVSDWKDDNLVGNVILNHADTLAKVYPSFINYIEHAKETIQHCDTNKRRFHAFLKVCQSKPECGRQSLTELLIRPVQRLPSVMLLLKAILKKTEKSNPDYAKVELAISKLDEVTKHINEDRRKAEGHQAMFDIVNDIENCPPSLLSAHRAFISKVDCLEVTDELSGRRDGITLFVFSDSLELCKRRDRILSTRSPTATPTHPSKTPQKAYRHLHVLQFSSIKRVVNIAETPECRQVFALITKSHEDKGETMYAFSLLDNGFNTTTKEEFLTALSKSICDHMCRTDYETLLTTVEPSVLHIDTSDIGNKFLSRAASKFGKRVSRAFSFNKNPRRLKRTMSSMTQIMSYISPFRRDSDAFTTPKRNNLRALASTNDLTDDSFYEQPFEGSQPESDLTYSELVDQMSLGTLTPVMRRRETLAGEDSPLSSMSRTPSTMSMASFIPESLV